MAYNLYGYGQAGSAPSWGCQTKKPGLHRRFTLLRRSGPLKVIKPQNGHFLWVGAFLTNLLKTGMGLGRFFSWGTGGPVLPRRSSMKNGSALPLNLRVPAPPGINERRAAVAAIRRDLFPGGKSEPCQRPAAGLRIRAFPKADRERADAEKTGSGAKDMLTLQPMKEKRHCPRWLAIEASIFFSALEAQKGFLWMPFTRDTARLFYL